MYSMVKTAIVRGLDCVFIQVEANVSDGMPMFEMVGFLSSEVKEARERVAATFPLRSRFWPRLGKSIRRFCRMP